jgi:uncharacterized protein YjbI with pentapeptide repeats
MGEGAAFDGRQTGTASKQPPVSQLYRSRGDHLLLSRRAANPLSGADLCGADLRGANLVDVDMPGMRYDDATRRSHDIDPHLFGAVKTELTRPEVSHGR